MKPGVPCDGGCYCWHPEGLLAAGWTATIQEDRIVILCPKCEEYWAEYRAYIAQVTK